MRSSWNSTYKIHISNHFIPCGYFKMNYIHLNRKTRNKNNAILSSYRENDAPAILFPDETVIINNKNNLNSVSNYWRIVPHATVTSSCLPHTHTQPVKGAGVLLRGSCQLNARVLPGTAAVHQRFALKIFIVIYILNTKTHVSPVLYLC